MLRPNILNRPRSVNVHRLLKYLQGATDIQVPFVLGCPVCYMCEFKEFDFNAEGILCQTCSKWTGNKSLIRFRRKEYIEILKKLPLAANGSPTVVRLGTPILDIAYIDLSTEVLETLDRMILTT